MFDEYLMYAFYVPPKHFSIRKLNRTVAVIELWIQDQTTNLYFGTELHSKVYKKNSGKGFLKKENCTTADQDTYRVIF